MFFNLNIISISIAKFTKINYNTLRKNLTKNKNNIKICQNKFLLNFQKGKSNMDLDKKIATRASYGEALCALGEKNDKIVVLDADLSEATKTNMFAKKFPNRFFDMGISEQDMMSTASGLASSGQIPFASTFAVFAARKSL